MRPLYLLYLLLLYLRYSPALPSQYIRNFVQKIVTLFYENVLGKFTSYERGDTRARSTQSASDSNSCEWRRRAEPESGCKNGIESRDCKKLGALSNAISRRARRPQHPRRP